MTDGDHKYTIYPGYCHELSPTIGKWCPLQAVDVHALQSVGMYDNGKEIYHHGNHPIKWVRITGVVVAVDEFSARRVFTIDDSSGMCIECTCPAPPPPSMAIPAHLDQGAGVESIRSTTQNRKPAPGNQASTPSVESPLVPWEEMDVGVVVKIKGKPNTFRDVKQVDIIKVEVMRSTEQEVRCWNEVVKFRKEVLTVPWVVSQEAEDKFRRRAEREKLYKNGSRTNKRSNMDKRYERDESKGKDMNVGKRRRGDESDDGGEKKGKHELKKRKHDKEEEGLKPENKANYPSLAARRRLAGKYDALGI